MAGEIHLVIVVVGMLGLAFARIAYAYFEKTSLGKPLAIIGVGYLAYILGVFGATLTEMGMENVGGISLEGFHSVFETIFILITFYGLYSFKKAFETFNWAEAKSEIH